MTQKIEDETLQALAALVNVLRERHHGRMPDEVQAAYDHAWAIVFGGEKAQQPVSGADGLLASPTRGMNLGQRIAHVGGRENSQGYVEFGSPMAVDALIQHILRDMTTSTPEGAFQARYRIPGGRWSSWGAVTCGVKGHEQELRYLATEAQPQPSENGLPERDTSRPAEQQGLFRKFDVRRTDGSDAPGGKHHGCRYFVLDIDHDRHAAAALTAYAAACEVTHPTLAADLRTKWGAQPSGNAGQPGERSAFEWWASDEGESPKAVERSANGVYKLSQTQTAWAVWQARAALAAQASAQDDTDDGGADPILEAIEQLRAGGQGRPVIARALSEWHEDDGNVIWWAWCGHEWAGEPAWCGTPLCDSWPGYHTHWTPHPELPGIDAARNAKGEA